jgi:hypothetical protein
MGDFTAPNHPTSAKSDQEKSIYLFLLIVESIANLA